MFALGPRGGSHHEMERDIVPFHFDNQGIFSNA
jgi:hypothetical protein